MLLFFSVIIIPLVSTLLTVSKHLLFWVNRYFKFTDLAYNPWTLQDKTLPKSRRWEIFFSRKANCSHYTEKHLLRLVLQINIGIPSWYDYVRLQHEFMFIITLNLCNAVFQAGGKIWLWKHNSNKQTGKDTLNSILYNKNVFKRNKERPGQIDC